MAYIDDEDETLDSSGNNKKDQSADSAALSSGSGGALVSPSASGQSTTQAQKPTDPGWTNLQSYLDANQDNAASMGNAVAGGIESKVADAQGSLKSVQQDFNSKAIAPSLDTEKANIDSAAFDPTAWANDDQKYNTVKNDLSGTYSGPNSLQELSGYSNAISKYNDADQKLNLTGNEAGRMTLLQDTYQRPDYNQGMKTLDQMLLENNSDARNSLTSLNGKYANLMNEIGLATNDSQALASQKAADAKATAAYANNAFSSAVQAQQDSLGQRVKEATDKENELNSHYDLLSQDLKNKTLTASEAQELGLPTSDFYAYNVDLPSFLQGRNTQVANTSNVATAEDAAKLNALYKLANQEGSFYLDPNQLGTFKQNSISLNPNVQQALQNKEAWNNMLNTTKIKDLNPNLKIADGFTIQQGIDHALKYMKPDGANMFFDANRQLTPAGAAFLKNDPNNPASQIVSFLLPYITGSSSVVKVNPDRGIR